MACCWVQRCTGTPDSSLKPRPWVTSLMKPRSLGPRLGSGKSSSVTSCGRWGEAVGVGAEGAAGACWDLDPSARCFAGTRQVAHQHRRCMLAPPSHRSPAAAERLGGETHRGRAALPTGPAQHPGGSPGSTHLHCLARGGGGGSGRLQLRRILGSQRVEPLGLALPLLPPVPGGGVVDGLAEDLAQAARRGGEGGCVGPRLAGTAPQGAGGGGRSAPAALAGASGRSQTVYGPLNLTPRRVGCRRASFRAGSVWGTELEGGFVRERGLKQ